MIAYPTWKSNFLLLNLQTKKRWIVCVCCQYLHSFVELVSFTKYYKHHVINETDMPSETLLCFRKKEKISNPSNYGWQPFCTSFKSQPRIVLTTVFFHKRLLWNSIPQTTVVADTAVPKWPEIIKYFKSRSSIYDHTRLWKVSHKKFTNHCSFSTKN